MKYHCMLPALMLVLIAAPALLAAAQPLNPPIDRKAWMQPSASTPLKVLKKQVISPGYPSPVDYMRVLERFPLYGERGWRDNYLGEPDLGFFGDPDNAEMGLRSMGNFIFVMSLLASDPAYDPEVTGIPQSQVLQRARTCLEYMTRSHVTGDIPCGNGKPWGDHWQSAWWAAKMALGADLIWGKLTPEEQERVRRVVTHEASRHLEREAPGGQLSNTRSEENAWDTEVMAAAVAMFPDDERAPAWRAKFIEFLLNSLSTEADTNSSTVVDGRPLSEQVYAVNVHSDYTIENHGAYHTCYMSCPLHSLAWGSWALESNGQELPEAQFHHFVDVWERMKPTFLEERFAYISGKDWPRYAYGMYFIMPALVALQQKFDDADARAIEARRFRAFEREQEWNADGSFFGKRFTRNVMMDRLLEYETDCYANLGVCYLMHKARGSQIPATPPAALNRNLVDAHISDEAELMYVRTPDLFASFSWKMLTGRAPVGLFIPAGMDSAAEWREGNLTGRVSVPNLDLKNAASAHRDSLTESGFETFGRIVYSLADGSPAFTHKISFSVDGTEKTARVESEFVANADLQDVMVEGLRLMVANDFFNGGRRVWHTSDGERVLEFDYEAEQLEEEVLTPTRLGSRWVNIDNRFGIIRLDSDEDFVIRVSNRRNAMWGSLHFDALDNPLERTRLSFSRGDTILKTSFLLVAGDADRTRALAGEINQ